MSEEDILKQIASLNVGIGDYRSQVNQHRRNMLAAETELIDLEIQKSRLEEQLRILKSKQGII